MERMRPVIIDCDYRPTLRTAGTSIKAIPTTADDRKVQPETEKTKL